MSNPNRKDENIRRANRVIQTRSFVLMLLMGVGMFVLLFFQLFDLQIVRHEELQSKAVSQQTRRTVVTASRGTIYDRTGNIMAISASAETIILSPLEIDRAVNDKDAPVSWTKDTLAAGLAELLDGDAAAIRKRMDNTKSQYEVIKLRAEEDTANAVRAYINENKIVGVHLVADAKRYYPYGSLASHVIGFVGDDNTGLYGLEARYEQELEGQSGMVVSTKDNAGNDMMYAYEQYFAAQNGSDLTLTLDTTIQYYLEKGLDTMLYKNLSEDGVEVSGGEAQKIAIARALYKDAPFIILDEPTAALDPIAEAEIYSKFDEIAGNKTAIYISHRLSSCKFCDEIAVFHEGAVVQQGSHAELLADRGGKYYALWNAQAQYYM